MRKNSGFTLIEMLVAVGILSVIIGASVSFFNGGTKIGVQSNIQSDLQQETLNAQQLIASNIKQSWYLFPTNTSISMGDGPTTGQWTVGDQKKPFIAMILTPLDPSVSCSANVSGCFRFRGYYAMPRSQWVKATKEKSWRNPGEDPLNNDALVIIEYRANYTTVLPTTPSMEASSVPTTGEANILADYIAQPINNGRMFTLTGKNQTIPAVPNPGAGLPATPAYQATTDNAVKIDIAAQRNLGGRIIRLPNATETYSITTAANNIGKVPVHR